MQTIRFTGQNMQITPALEEYTNKKFTRLEQYAKRITDIHVTFNVDKLRQIAQATVSIPGHDIHAQAESENMYNAITALVDKLSSQLKKHKEKLANH